MGRASRSPKPWPARPAKRQPKRNVRPPQVSAYAHAPQRSERAVQHKPLSLSQAADMAAKQAQKAQAMAFMRSPQYWASQQATHETKRFGSMPRLPLLSPLNPAAADA